MTPSSILSEHYGRSRTLRQDDIERFRAEGVPDVALSQPHLIKRDWVTFCGNHRFEYERYCDHDEGQLAYVLPATNCLGEISDVIAWRGNMVATWLGSIGLAGEENAYGFRLDADGGIDVHPTILDWLRADRRGVVIVDPVRAPGILDCAGPLRASSFEHGRELRHICSRSGPTILVPASGRLAA